MWQLITVAPNSETRVARVLDKGLDLDVLTFRVRRKVVVRGRVIVKRVPAFPGYVFVAAGAAFRSVRAVVGVFDFVRIGEEVAKVAAAVVDDLLDLAVDDGTLPVEEQPASRFQAGDRVLIRNLSFDAVGVFQSLEANGRAIVLLDWLGRSVPASVAEVDLALDKPRNLGDYPRRKRHRPGRRQRIKVSWQRGVPACSLG